MHLYLSSITLRQCRSQPSCAMPTAGVGHSGLSYLSGWELTWSRNGRISETPLLYRCRRAMCPIWYAPVMAAKTDNLLARQEFILHQLQESGTISIEELCSTLGASIATIRRDLEDLESR